MERIALLLVVIFASTALALSLEDAVERMYSDRVDVGLGQSDLLAMRQNARRVVQLGIEDLRATQDPTIRRNIASRVVSPYSTALPVEVRQRELALPVAEQLAVELVEPRNSDLIGTLRRILVSMELLGLPEEASEPLLDLLEKKLMEAKPKQGRVPGGLPVLLEMAGLSHQQEALSLIAQVQGRDDFDVGSATFYDDTWWPHSAAWNALKASARLYQSADVERAIQKIDRSHPLGNLDELIYIRQPQVVDYLEQYLAPEYCGEVLIVGDVLGSPPAYKAIGALRKLYPDLETELEAFHGPDQTQGPPPQETAAFVKEWLAQPENRNLLRAGLPEIDPPEWVQAK